MVAPWLDMIRESEMPTTGPLSSFPTMDKDDAGLGLLPSV